MRIVMDDDKMADVLRGRNPERDQGHTPKHVKFKDDRQQKTMSFATVQSKKGPRMPDNRNQNTDNSKRNPNQYRSGQKETSQENGGARLTKLCIFCAKAGHAH